MKNLASDMVKFNRERRGEIISLREELREKRLEYDRLLGMHSEASARGDDVKAIQSQVKAIFRKIEDLEAALKEAEERREFTDVEIKQAAMEERQRRIDTIQADWEKLREMKAAYLKLLESLGGDFRDLLGYCRVFEIPFIGGSGAPEWSVFAIDDKEISAAYGTRAADVPIFRD